MEITGFRFEELTGRLDVDPADFYESRLSRPLDLYPEYRATSALEWWGGGATEETAMDADADGIEITQTFLFVETDEGVEGVAGPIGEEWARTAAGFEGLLVGEDPRATERCWDLMYREAVHGRKGKRMQAISAVDVALWDAKGKAVGEPVHRLLGGPCRTELPAYASMLAFSADPEDARETAAEYREKGYPAQKWFFRNGVGSGAEGKRDNAALVAAVREATGEDYDLFFDAWMSWNRAYALDMIDRIAEYGPDWVEEPVQPDRIDGYAELRRAADFPIAGGEHEYTRYGIHELLDRGAVDVLQPDTMWAGGITELRHVCSLASVHDIPVIPHGHLVPANAQVIAAHPETVCPLVEYLVRWNEKLQLFFETPTKPEDGHVTVPDRPGIGVEIDRDRAEAVREPEY
jgi:L-alanine-DL-glutamate epimerase-like enolase superfamily enzyme